MLDLRPRVIGGALVAAALLLAPGVASAALLVSYELTGVNSPVTSVPATFSATGLAGTPITRNGGLVDVASSTNGFNSAGWDSTNPNANVRLGFTVTGSPVSVNEFKFATRASATGPGSIDVLFSVNGGAFFREATIIQPSITFVDEDLVFAPVTVLSSLVIEFVVTPGSLAANGGAIGTQGTWRISDYSPDNGQTFQAVQILGSAVSAVPEPSSLVLVGIAMAGAVVVARVRPVPARRATFPGKGI